jgi:biotin transporter BioY
MIVYLIGILFLISAYIGFLFGRVFIMAIIRWYDNEFRNEHWTIMASLVCFIGSLGNLYFLGTQLLHLIGGK